MEGGGGSAETGNPRPVLYENSSIAQSLQRVEGDDLPGDYSCTHSHTHVHRPARLEECRRREKATPARNISQQVCTPRSKFNALLFFHLLPAARGELLKLRRGWYGFAFGGGPAKFVYTYSTIHRSTL